MSSLGTEAGLTIPDATRLSQRRAADPAASAWVSANAGAGKTKVLTDRVIRLLLEGVPPGRILCLTFTKAAAAEMTIRVFRQLGAWVTLDDAALADTISDLVGERPDRARVLSARRLFARAIETPGGLKIETIHAFCERILHLVPFEANVPARFAVLDDAQSGELLAEARERVLTQAAGRSGGGEALARALDVTFTAASGDTLTAVLSAAVNDARVPGTERDRLRAVARLRAALGLDPDGTSDTVRRAIVEGGLSAAELIAIADTLAGSKAPTDRDNAECLRQAATAPTLESRADIYLSVFLTLESRKRKNVCTKGMGEALCRQLSEEAERLESLADRLRSARALERTDALFTLAGAIRRARDGLKTRLGALDFDDLIAKTLELLSKGSSAWVLYKLDRGVDHVLVDEAQDTNPDQWRILRHLTEEFTAGHGVPGRARRTLFAVGDPKQSIYSFQGADPRWFEDSRQHWRKRSHAADLAFHDVTLDLSFRSAPAVLDAVDATFRDPDHFRGLSFDDKAVGTSHESARPHAPGHVEVWSTEFGDPEATEPDAWRIPVDQPEPTSPSVMVAERVAAAVRAWTRTGDEAGRVWRPRDVMILVRKRNAAFFALIRALKGAGVPVAGADRFDINEHIAVNDLVAAGQCAVLPEGDLVLATALKSPLVGFDDDDLIRIAADRAEGETLAAALARMADEGDAGARAGHAALTRWRGLARVHGPFGFYATLLGPGGGRRQLIERLGSEAADAIDAFLGYAEAAEGGPETPSLVTFLARFEGSEHTIKRDLDSSGDEVKVMTVHGAKGLEAAIVVVVDGCDVGDDRSVLIPLPTREPESPLVVWSSGRAYDSGPIAEARSLMGERASEEHNRLLYVAMTRAKDRLVLAPFGGAKGEPETAWCAMVRRSLQGDPRATVRAHERGDVLVWSDGQTGAAATEASSTAMAWIDVPAWLTEAAPREPEPSQPLRPSGAPDRAGGGNGRGPAPASARRRGILVHGLIEYLAGHAPQRRAEAAERFVMSRAPRLDAGERARILADVARLLDDATLAPLFGPGSRGEAGIAGDLIHPETGEVSAVSGQVDRMVVLGREVLVADFKTGGARDEHVAQIALYRALLAQIYPDRPVRAFLILTTGPVIVEPSPAELRAALLRALDGSG